MGRDDDRSYMHNSENMTAYAVPFVISDSTKSQNINSQVGQRSTVLQLRALFTLMCEQRQTRPPDNRIQGMISTTCEFVEHQKGETLTLC